MGYNISASKRSNPSLFGSWAISAILQKLNLQKFSPLHGTRKSGDFRDGEISRLPLPGGRVDESIQSVIALVILLTAAFGPLVGLGWLLGMMDRRVSMKEMFAYVGYWGLIFAAWTTLARILVSA